jgi:hypothetical protein
MLSWVWNQVNLYIVTVRLQISWLTLELSETVSISASEMFFQEAGISAAVERGFWEQILVSNGACHLKEIWGRKQGNIAWFLILDFRTFLEWP